VYGRAASALCSLRQPADSAAKQQAALAEQLAAAAARGVALFCGSIVTARVEP